MDMCTSIIIGMGAFVISAVIYGWWFWDYQRGGSDV